MPRVVYSPEFKSQVIKEARETDNATLVARKHNLPQKTVSNWVMKEVNKKSISDNKSFKMLEKNNRELQLENQILKDILKKTVQIWSNE